jgi:hypothetical protein
VQPRSQFVHDKIACRHASASSGILKLYFYKNLISETIFISCM